MALVRLTRVLWNVRYPELSSFRKFSFTLFVPNFAGTFISLRFFLMAKFHKTLFSNPFFNSVLPSQISQSPGCKENHFYSLPFRQAEASIY